MSDSRPRINPRHRNIDVERLAAALLDLAPDIDLDEDDLALGAQIHARLDPSAHKLAHKLAHTSAPKPAHKETSS